MGEGTPSGPLVRSMCDVKKLAKGSWKVRTTGARVIDVCAKSNWTPKPDFSELDAHIKAHEMQAREVASPAANSANTSVSEEADAAELTSVNATTAAAGASANSTV